MLVLCAVFARRLWRCAASRGEWREARAAPRVARMAPESALDEPAGAARAPCKLAHRLHAAVDSLVDGGQSRGCQSKPAGFVTPFTQSFFVPGERSARLLCMPSGLISRRASRRSSTPTSRSIRRARATRNVFWRGAALRRAYEASKASPNVQTNGARMIGTKSKTYIDYSSGREAPETVYTDATVEIECYAEIWSASIVRSWSFMSCSF